jgi:hypothetical protein
MVTIFFTEDPAYVAVRCSGNGQANRFAIRRLGRKLANL